MRGFAISVLERNVEARTPVVGAWILWQRVAATPIAREKKNTRMRDRQRKPVCGRRPVHENLGNHANDVTPMWERVREPPGPLLTSR